MKAGEKIFVHTNYELVNKLLNKDLKGWMSTVYKFSDYPQYCDAFIWMVYLDGKKHYGWVNNCHNTSILEDYVGGKPYPNNIDDGLNIKRRFVFEKVGNGAKRYYVFRGFYELETGSNREHRVLRMISNEADLF